MENTKAVYLALLASTDPLGAMSADVIAATGLTQKAVGTALCRLAERSAIYTAGPLNHRRYYATTEARDAAALALDAYVAEQRRLMMIRRVAKRRALDAARAPARRAAREAASALRSPKPAKPAKPDKPPKPPKVEKPKAVKPPKAKVKPKRHPKQVVLTVAKSKQPKAPAFKDLPPTNPNNVQTQVIPGYTGERWRVEIPSDGFVAEWNAKRGVTC